MNIINLDKEKEIAIKAAKLAGKLLKEDKNILNLKTKLSIYQSTIFQIFQILGTCLNTKEIMR